MITVFAYWFGLLWNVPLEKEMFAAFSIVEFAIEMILLVTVLPAIISINKKG